MQASPIQRRGGLAPWQLRKVRAVIEAHLGESISGQQLASSVRLSRCYFARVFRQSTGMSPHSYVTRRRIERAQHLMLSTNATLLEIALECGFADQSHLSRTFCKLFGETPRSWRNARVARAQSSPQSIHI
jgi:AraC family transcriptional regulator